MSEDTQSDDSQDGRKQARGTSARRVSADTPEDHAREQAAHASRMASEAPKTGASRRGEDDGGEEAPASKQPEAQAEPEAQAQPEAPAEPEAQAQPEAPAEPEEELDPIEYGVEWLGGVFERMNFAIEVGGKIENDRLYFNARGEDAEFLLGIGTAAPKSIEAIQTLLGAALARMGERRDIFLDVGGWRDERSDRLEEVASELGEVATKLGKSVTVAGFNSYERRVVHNTLSENSAVRTDSHGKGIFRKLTIYPE